MATADDVLGAHLALAGAAWPDLRRDHAAYEAWLRAACAGDAAVLERLPSLVPEEVVVGWACATGDPAAQALLDRRYLRQIPDAIRRVRVAAPHVDDVVQHVRIKLLTSRPENPGGAAAIGQFVLGGSLSGLIRVIAVRYALTLDRQRRSRAEVDDGGAEAVGEVDPVLRDLKRRYAAEFELALREALAGLSARQRQLLRLHLSAQASIDDLARIYRTHRATAARWLEAARMAVADGVHERLAARLELDPDALQSLLRLIRTEAARQLASIPPEAE